MTANSNIKPPVIETLVLIAILISLLIIINY
jgi:hypothetical protein